MKKAFTLSEVLITLSVVGIVAVLTVPGVMKNYQNKLYTAQLQKVYSQIAEATKAMMNDEHVDNFYETSIITGSCNEEGVCSNPGVGYFLSNYFKNTKNNCGGTCTMYGDDDYKSLTGTSIAGGLGGHSCSQTASGATICGVLNRAIGGDNSRKCLSLTVDVNGLSQPNVTGRDIFAMDIHDDGSVSDYGSGCMDGSMGMAASKCPEYTEGEALMKAAGGCLNKIIDDGWKMEY